MILWAAGFVFSLARSVVYVFMAGVMTMFLVITWPPTVNVEENSLAYGLACLSLGIAERTEGALGEVFPNPDADRLSRGLYMNFMPHYPGRQAEQEAYQQRVRPLAERMRANASWVAWSFDVVVALVIAGVWGWRVGQGAHMPQWRPWHWAGYVALAIAVLAVLAGVFFFIVKGDIAMAFMYVFLSAGILGGVLIGPLLWLSALALYWINRWDFITERDLQAKSKAGQAA